MALFMDSADSPVNNSFEIFNNSFTANELRKFPENVKLKISVLFIIYRDF